MDITPPPALPVEVRRSGRRRRTATAYRRDGRIVVLVPARLSRREERRVVGDLVRRLQARGVGGGDQELMERARALGERYLGGLAHPVSVRWVTNQRSRWGSCTPLNGTIRLSHRLQGMPEYVVDYVILHELAHLLQPDHGRSFWGLLAGYPDLARARGFLEGVDYASDASPAVPEEVDEQAGA